MCTSLIPCPLCSQPHFNSLESLRIGLIKVATENLVCPICNGIFMGLDKLTIHLFSHCESILLAKKTTEDESQKTKFVVRAQKESNKSSAAENSITSKRLTKYQKTHSNSELTSTSSEPNALSRNLPVFNMNTLPFIGIPENISGSIHTNVANQDLQKHDTRHNKILSERCDICGFYFLGKNILQMHKKLIHNFQDSQPANNVSKYPCHLCAKVFKLRGSLMVHLRMVHLGIGPSDALSNKNARHKEADKAHKQQAESIKLEEKPAEESKSIKRSSENKPCQNDSNEQTNNANNKQWECDICRKLFTTKYFLKKHKRLHTGEMPYSCSQCNKTFTFQQSYHKHLLYHNDDKPHTCSHCGRSFKELSTLHNHQRIHTGEKPFSCESCGKCFRQRVSYLVHRRIHTGAMPYKCTSCEKSFRYKVSQRTHKCTAQPPGLVVRQSGELVQKLIKHQTDISNNNSGKDISFGIETNPNMFTDQKSPAMNAKDPKKPIESSSNATDNLSSIIDSNLFNKKCNEEEKNIIDEIINDSIKKIDFGELRNSLSDNFNPAPDLYAIVSNDQIAEQDLPSPSERMKNLKLSPAVSPGRILDIRAGDRFQLLPSLDQNNYRHEYGSNSSSYSDSIIFGQMYQ